MIDEFEMIISFLKWSAKSQNLIIFCRMFLTILHFELNCTSLLRFRKYDAELISVCHLFCLNLLSVSWISVSFTSCRIAEKILTIWMIWFYLRKLFINIFDIDSDLFLFHVLKFFQYILFVFRIATCSSSLKSARYLSEMLHIILWCS